MSLVVSFWKLLEASNKCFINRNRAKLLAARLQCAVNSVEDKDVDTTELASFAKDAFQFLRQFQKDRFAWSSVFSPTHSETFEKFNKRLDGIQRTLGIKLEQDMEARCTEDLESLLCDLSDGRQLIQAASSSIPAHDRDVIGSNILSLSEFYSGSSDVVTLVSEAGGTLANEIDGGLGKPVSEVVDGDRAALVVLRESACIRHQSWHAASSLHDWYGVFADECGRVTGLSLWASGLKGSIPRELGSLVHLTSLWLPGNKLSGTGAAQNIRTAQLVISRGMCRRHPCRAVSAGEPQRTRPVGQQPHRHHSCGDRQAGEAGLPGLVRQPPHR
jgi:hypothetical protein